MIYPYTLYKGTDDLYSYLYWFERCGENEDDYTFRVSRIIEAELYVKYCDVTNYDMEFRVVLNSGEAYSYHFKTRNNLSFVVQMRYGGRFTSIPYF